MPRKSTLYHWLLQAIENHASDECLLWPFCKIPDGYGTVYNPETKQVQLVHRIAFKITHGHWPEPQGRHTCDVPACFNPLHIVEGTHAENMRDKVERLRQPCGEIGPNAKLTAEIVAAIRAEYVPRRHQHLDAKYGINRTTIRRIVRHITWV